MKARLLSLISLAALTGCVLTGCVYPAQSPETRIKGSLAGKPFSFTGPKDVTAESIEVRAETNGAVSLSVKGLNAKNNPETIAATGAANAALSKIRADAFNDGLTNGAAIAGKILGTAAATAIK